MDLELAQRGDNGVGLFMCACSDAGARECDELMTEVKARLGEEYHKDGTPIADAEFLSSVVVSLNWDFSAHIDGIHNDQWSAVSASEYKDSRNPDHKPFHVYAQCDEVECGIAAVWKVFADRKLTLEKAEGNVDEGGPRENTTGT